MASTAFRVFVSSPGDVGFERRVALAIIDRLSTPDQFIVRNPR